MYESVGEFSMVYITKKLYSPSYCQEVQANATSIGSMMEPVFWSTQHFLPILYELDIVFSIAEGVGIIEILFGNNQCANRAEQLFN